MSTKNRPLPRERAHAHRVGAGHGRQEAELLLARGERRTARPACRSGRAGTGRSPGVLAVPPTLDGMIIVAAIGNCVSRTVIGIVDLLRPCADSVPSRNAVRPARAAACRAARRPTQRGVGVEAAGAVLGIGPDVPARCRPAAPVLGRLHDLVLDLLRRERRVRLAHQQRDAGDERRRHARAAVDRCSRSVVPASAEVIRDAGRRDVGLDAAVERRAAARVERVEEAAGPEVGHRARPSAPSAPRRACRRCTGPGPRCRRRPPRRGRRRAPR